MLYKNQWTGLGFVSLAVHVCIVYLIFIFLTKHIGNPSISQHEEIGIVSLVDGSQSNASVSTVLMISKSEVTTLPLLGNIEKGGAILKRIDLESRVSAKIHRAKAKLIDELINVNKLGKEGNQGGHDKITSNGLVIVEVPRKLNSERIAHREHMVIIHDVEPEYSPTDKKKENRLSVTVRLYIDEEGTVDAVALIGPSHDAAFNEAVMKAATQWKFIPAVEDGKPVKAYTDRAYTFIP